MLKKGKIVLSKGAGEKSKTDIPENVMQTKQDKVIQEALALEFSAANPSKKFQDWEEIATLYGMSENFYGMLQKKCDAWVKSKLQVGKSNLEFPLDVQMYIKWIVNISVAKDITKDLPWHIPMVSLAMEGELFLARLFPNSMPIGLCILDNTEGSAQEMQWSTERFSHLLSGILTITRGTRNPQCVLLAFVRISDLMRLKDALQSVSGWHKMFFGAIHFMRDAPCPGAIQLFSVLIYLSKGERFDGYGSISSSEGPILDESLLDIEYKIVRPMDPRAYLREKKTMLINKCINLYCTEGLMVIDAYSNGFVSWCALKERREVMGLVESIKEREELHSELISFTTLDRQVKEWANIVEDLQTTAQEQQQAIESSISETQLVLENKTPPSKPFDPRDDESKNMDEDQRKIVKELEGVQDNKAKPCNDLRDYQQNISGHDGEGPRGATEHQLEPMLLGTKVHEGTSSPTQPSSNLQDDESENEDEDQTNIVKGLEGVQVNKPNLYNNDDREYRQKLLINDTEGSHGATEHQLQPILLEAKVHEDASTLARQPSSSLQVQSGRLFGHVISKDSISMDLDKIATVMEAPAPMNSKQCAIFLGQAPWHGKHLQFVTHLAIPINQAAHAKVSEWTLECDLAYRRLKIQLSKAPIMIPPNWDRDFHVFVDASNRLFYIWYASKILTGRLARWVLLLKEFDFEVILRPKAHHAVADYLSWLDYGEPPMGIADEFLDSSLFLTSFVAKEVPMEQSIWMILSIP
ncbi:hypothetical protein L7F22_046418 [Adiantum nelumboides]|nr:hypothetical protein [Adiantum nelumboides]